MVALLALLVIKDYRRGSGLSCTNNSGDKPVRMVFLAMDCSQHRVNAALRAEEASVDVHLVHGEVVCLFDALWMFLI
jgi:hypothetical protein